MLTLNTTTRLGAVDQVVAYVKGGIQSGDLKVGDKLPNEADLAAMIGVGRSSLREGMRILNAYGLVDIRQGDGTYIDNKSEERFIEILNLQTTGNYQYLMELRRVLETGSIALVSPKITDLQIEELQELVDMLVPSNDITKVVDADRAFHTKLIEITGNPLIISLNNMIYQNRMSLLLTILTDRAILNDAKTAHQSILDALRTRDVTKCIEAVTNHLDVTLVHLSNMELI